MTTMVDKPDPAVDSRQSSAEKRVEQLRTAVWLLGILVVVLGAWIVYDYSQDTALAPTPEISDLIDDYVAAWNNYDGEAFLALTREGYTYTSNMAGTFDRDEQLDVIENTLPSQSWSAELLGDPVMVGDGPWWHVAMPVRITSMLSDVMDGTCMLTVYDADGTYLITRHIFNGR